MIKSVMSVGIDEIATIYLRHGSLTNNKSTLKKSSQFTPRCVVLEPEFPRFDRFEDV